jgi:hypothetical protein
MPRRSFSRTSATDDNGAGAAVDAQQATYDTHDDPDSSHCDVESLPPYAVDSHDVNLAAALECIHLQEAAELAQLTDVTRIPPTSAIEQEEWVANR